MTQAEFNALPLLLTPQMARGVFGCNKDTLLALEGSVVELVIRVPGMKHRRYRKVIVAKMIGMSEQHPNSNIQHPEKNQ